MQLFITNQRGQEVELNPTVSTRQEIVDTVGETFTLGGSDYLYHAHEVYAKPDPDTSVAVALLMALFAYMVALNWNISFGAMILFYFISKVYFYFDKKAVKKFNESTTF